MKESSNGAYRHGLRVGRETLAADHETPNGINERIRTSWSDPHHVERLTRALANSWPLSPRVHDGAAPRMKAVRMYLQASTADQTRLLSLDIRRKIIEMSASPNGVHIGGSISIADLLAVLYAEVLRHPSDDEVPDRDHLILSKGQASAALYAVLALTGAITEEECSTYAQEDSRLCGHPMKHLPGVDFSTGALGHGLPIGLGVALAGRRYGHDKRAFVILGDGELQEGSNWEAAMAASHLGADNLIAVVDRNDWQISGRTEDCMALEPLADKWSSFGWNVSTIDGHDHEEIRSALGKPSDGQRPTVVIAKTVKAHRIPGLHDTKQSHSATLDTQARELAFLALEGVRT